jgi:hypothetical protein
VDYDAPLAEEVGFEPTTGISPYAVSSGVSVTSRLLPALRCEDSNLDRVVNSHLSCR